VGGRGTSEARYRYAISASLSTAGEVDEERSRLSRYPSIARWDVAREDARTLKAESA
jgi:hypothetical protein